MQMMVLQSLFSVYLFFLSSSEMRPPSTPVSRRSGPSRTRTARGAAAPSRTRPRLSCWNTTKALTSPACTGSSLTVAHLVTVRTRSTSTVSLMATPTTSTHEARGRAASEVDAKRADTSWEAGPPEGRLGGARPGLYYHCAPEAPQRTRRDTTPASHRISRLSRATTVRVKLLN